MLTTHFGAFVFSGALMVLGAGVVSAQGYPNKPIRIISPEAGSGIDFQARVIAQGISGALGQPVVIDNRPPLLIAEMAARAAPDGYTVAAGASAIWITPLLQKTSYDPVKDLSPITLITSSPFLVVVHPSLPVKSVKELIALAKAKPGQVNYGSGPTGGGAHLSGALFKAMAGVNIVLVPFSAGAPGLNALLAGEVQMMINTAATTMPHVKSGRVRGLAVTSTEPSMLAPGLPTVAAAGLPGYENAVIAGILAPAGTPAAIINRLNQEIVRVLNGADVKEKFLNAGADTLGGAPDQFAAKIKSEMAKWGKVLKDTGIEAQ